MELRQIDRILLKILYLVIAGIVVTQVFGMENITSMMFYLTFPLTVFVWFRTVRSKLVTTDIIMLGAVALAVINVFLNAGITDSDLGFSYLRKLIMFIMTLMFLQASFRIKIDRKMADFFIKTTDCLVLFLISAYFIFGSQMYMLNGIVTRYLTFRFANPNLTGIFLVCFYIFELYRLFSPENWKTKILHVAMAGFIGYFIYETQSRNSAIVLIIITAFSALLFFRKNNKMYIGRLAANLISFFPALFVGFYIPFINSRWIQEGFGFLVSVGKSLDSRLVVWEPAVAELINSPVIGAYSQISKGTGMSQMHNTHLDIMCSYGILVFVLVCVLITKYLHQNGKVYVHKENYIYILGFACTIMLGMGEAALFSGGLGMYVFAGTFLMMVEKKNE